MEEQKDELREFTEELENEARESRRKSLDLLGSMLGRFRVRHVKRNGKRVEIAGRLPHARQMRPSRDMRGYKSKTLYRKKPVAAVDRRRQQDRLDAERAVVTAIALGVVAKPNSARELEARIQDTTRQLMKQRGGW